MAFTAEEITNISNSTLQYHERGQPISQIKQVRPLFDRLESNKMEFGGGDFVVTGPVKGVYTSRFEGYTHDDDLAYRNPANVKRWQARWYELHAGISFSGTELKANGIHVVDSNDGKETTKASDSEVFQLVDMLLDKQEDLDEGGARSFAEHEWRDGTQDSKVFPGMLSIITNAPTTGMKFGIDAGLNTWWRNIASLAVDSTTAANQNLVNDAQKRIRQLRRYGNPNHAIYAGSDYMDAFEKELRSKGNYTLEGWANKRRIDASVADLAFKGIDIEYEPLLDDLSLSKYSFWVDHKAIKLRPMSQEDMKSHTPMRPPEKMMFFRAKTWTGFMSANQLNTSMVQSIL